MSATGARNNLYRCEAFPHLGTPLDLSHRERPLESDEPVKREGTNETRAGRVQPKPPTLRYYLESEKRGNSR